MFKKVTVAVILGICLMWAGCSDSGAPAGGSGGGRGDGYGGGRASSGAPRNPSRPPAPATPGVQRGSGGGPLFQLPMSDGRMVTVQAPAALFFFTTWCGYCKQAMPEINRLAAKAPSRGWRVYGIDVGEGASQVNGFIQQYQPQFPVLLDQSSQVAGQYRVGGYPTFVLIDENGRIIYNGHDVPRNL